MQINVFDIILGLSLLIAGGLVTRYFSGRRKVSWVATRRKVLDPVSDRHPDDLEIIFENEKIDNLIEWKVAVWNSGNVGIRADDFLDEPALHFTFANEQVLRVGDALRSRDVVGGDAQIDESRITLQRIGVLDTTDWIAFDVYSREVAVDGDELKFSKKLVAAADIMHLPKGLSKSSRPFARTLGEKVFFVLGLLLYVGFGGLALNEAFGNFSDIRSSALYHDLVAYLTPSVANVLSYLFTGFIALFGLIFGIGGLLVLILSPFMFFTGPPKEIADRLFADEQSLLPWKRLRKSQ